MVERWLAIGVGVVLVGACASGGPQIDGDPQMLFEKWNGSWILDSTASEDPAEALTSLATARASSTARGSGGRGGGGKGGGRGGSGRGGGGRGGGGGAEVREADSGAIQATLSLARQLPSRIHFELSDSTFTIASAPGSLMALPMDGDRIDVPNQGVRMEARVEWSGASPTVTRSLKNGGMIVDAMQLATDNRLLVTRRVSLRSSEATFRFVLDRGAS